MTAPGTTPPDRLAALRELHPVVREWTAHVPQNLPYVDLMFAFGFATAGGETDARRLLEQARAVMVVPTPTSWYTPREFEAVVAGEVSNFLFKAFQYRIEESLAGRPHFGRMPAAVFAASDEIATKARDSGNNNPFMRVGWIINRLRHDSRLLEPIGWPNPYTWVVKPTDSFGVALVELTGIRHAGQLVDRVRLLLANEGVGEATAHRRLRILAQAVPLAPLAGEEFTRELLGLVTTTLTDCRRGGSGRGEMAPPELGQFLDRTCYMAGYYGSEVLARELAQALTAWLPTVPVERQITIAIKSARECLRTLHTLGLTAEASLLLTYLEEDVLPRMPLGQFRAYSAGLPGSRWNQLRLRLMLSAGYLRSGNTESATPILDAARTALLGPEPGTTDFADLARDYIATLGELPGQAGVPGILEFFRGMDRNRITNTTTTAECYSRFHLSVVEEAILALARNAAE